MVHQCSTHHNLGEPQLVVVQGQQVEAEPDQNHLEDADSTVGMIDKNEIDKECLSLGRLALVHVGPEYRLKC